MYGPGAGVPVHGGGVPVHGGGVPVHGGGELLIGQPDGRAERRRMHTPLVLRAGQRAGAQDHHLAQGGSGVVDQAAGAAPRVGDHGRGPALPGGARRRQDADHFPAVQEHQAGVLEPASGVVGPIALAVSLALVHKRCGQPSCGCHHGGPADPAHHLTYKDGGKTRTVYVPHDLLEDVRAWIAEHQRLKTLLDEIHQLTVALVRTHARHQKRKAGRP